MVLQVHQKLWMQFQALSRKIGSYLAWIVSRTVTLNGCKLNNSNNSIGSLRIEDIYTANQISPASRSSELLLSSDLPLALSQDRFLSFRSRSRGDLSLSRDAKSWSLNLSFEDLKNINLRSKICWDTQNPIKEQEKYSVSDS